MRKLFSFFILVTLLASCTAKKAIRTSEIEDNHHEHKYQFPYDIHQANKSFELPEILNEISGITLFNKNTICAIQDENGIIFYLDKETGKIIDQKRFRDDGDYEDITCSGEGELCIIKSSGTLYHVEETTADTFSVEKMKFGLSKDHDVEGLFYDKKENRLLIACKEDLIKDQKNSRGVYAFDLKTKQLKPAYVVTLQEVENFLRTYYPDSEERFDFLKKEDELISFAPSAIALHPFTRNLYILSSKGKWLCVISPDNHFLHIEKLDKTKHRQPEGMFFDTDGTLYISNESKKDNPANIQRFSMKKSK